eukprot:4113662-Amphidinium_carterae.2
MSLHNLQENVASCIFATMPVGQLRTYPCIDDRNNSRNTGSVNTISYAAGTVTSTHESSVDGTREYNPLLRTSFSARQVPTL